MERGNIEHKLWLPSPRSPPHTFSLGLLQKREVDVGMRGNGIERLSEGQSWGQMLALSFTSCMVPREKTLNFGIQVFLSVKWVHNSTKLQWTAPAAGDNMHKAASTVSLREQELTKH